MSIRKIVSLVAAVAFTAVSAAPAFAVTVTRADGQPMNPNGEPFSATGTTNLSKGCDHRRLYRDLQRHDHVDRYRQHHVDDVHGWRNMLADQRQRRQYVAVDGAG